MHSTFDHKELFVLACRRLVMNLIVGDEIVSAHGCDEDGYANPAQRAGVELLLVHQSISVIESAARMAFALRNDVKVRNFVPFDSVLSSFALFVAATRTDRTISVDMEPSFLMSF